MTYYIHHVAVFDLFVYLTYSKLAHIFYRGAALAFLKYSGRESKSQEQSSITQSGSEPKQESGQE